ncbi:hypothetical protein AFLA70_712g000361 [Aspergillus flavus AF70]|nr:hypothetical protein AFLA70_712g000361 [Aspergillus flavus AF70]
MDGPLSSTPVIGTLLAVIPFFFVARIFYRLYLHPLSKYPGPRLAAISSLYRAYHQTWRDGRLVEQLTHLHEIYGPVVRITPNTLHFRNPQAFHDIFSPQNKTVKDQEFYHHLGLPDSSFRLEGEEHGARMKLMAPLFARSHLDEIQNIVGRNVQRFCDLLQCSVDSDKPIELALGYRGLALDIINEFIFADIPDSLRGLQNERFRNPLAMSTYYSFDWTMWLMRNFPLTIYLHDIASYLPSCLKFGYEQRNVMMELMTNLLHFNLSSPEMNKRATLIGNMTKPTSLRNGKPLPESALLDEAVGVMHGGVLDISNVLPYGTFCLAQDFKLQQKLYEELKGVWKNPADPIPDYEVLRKLPFLKGVVKESLRFTHGVISGMPRIVTANGATIDGNSIPPGTSVATSSIFLHMDPTIFVDPKKFSPERWGTDDTLLERSLVPFSKGRRMCPASNISYMEISTAFAAVFRKFEVSLYETTEEDMKYKAYASIHYTGRPLRATLKNRVD